MTAACAAGKGSGDAPTRPRRGCRPSAQPAASGMTAPRAIAAHDATCAGRALGGGWARAGAGQQKNGAPGKSAPGGRKGIPRRPTPSTGFVCKELIPKAGGGGSGGGVPQSGRLFEFDFPAAKFWVKIFFGGGWVSEPKDPPPPSDKHSLAPPTPSTPFQPPPKWVARGLPPSPPVWPTPVHKGRPGHGGCAPGGAGASKTRSMGPCHAPPPRVCGAAADRR